MIGINKFAASEIDNIFPTNCALISFVSFEARCLSLINNVSADKINHLYLFRNVNRSMDSFIQKNMALVQCKNIKVTIKDINLNSSVNIADIIAETIQNIKHRKLVIDITTFTHEALLILIKNLYLHQSSFDSILLIYNGAKEYSPWLSKGCKEVRNVIGFPGIFNPSYKYHLIILTGFEYERATRLVELMEPDILSMGNGVDPINNNHLGAMQNSKERFEKWLQNLQSVPNDAFEFSCSDIEKTIEKLKEFVENGQNENLIMVPLNTKLSTLSVALVALKNNKIQVVYPIPEVYNTNYSIPSDNFTAIDLLKLPEFTD